MPDSDAVHDAAHDAMYAAFVNGELGADEWTHEAHLITCWMALRTRTPIQALDHLRQAITTHNCGIGIENSDDSGYHETLTVYYVTAIAALDVATPEELFDHPDTDRSAPLRFWSKDVLMSTAARRGWIEPDLAPLPWAPIGAATAN